MLQPTDGRDALGRATITADDATYRYTITDLVAVSNIFLVEITRHTPGEGKPDVMRCQLPTNFTDKTITRRVALETIFQFWALGNDYDDEAEKKTRLVKALDRAYTIHRKEPGYRGQD